MYRCGRRFCPPEILCPPHIANCVQTTSESTLLVNHPPTAHVYFPYGGTHLQRTEFPGTPGMLTTAKNKITEI